MLVRPDNLPSDLKVAHLMQRNYHISSNVYDIVVKFEEIKNMLLQPYHLTLDLKVVHLMQRNYNISSNVYDIVVKFMHVVYVIC